MADRITLVARELNRVKSAGEARAALNAARAEVDRGLALAPRLSRWSSPTPQQAQDTLIMLRGALAAELRLIEAMAATSGVDAATWARQRRQVERVYVEVAGIEGVLGELDRIDVASILGEAIRGAPKLVGKVLGEVTNEAGKAAGGLGGGILSGIGLAGIVLVAVVLVVVLKVR